MKKKKIEIEYKFSEKEAIETTKELTKSTNKFVRIAPIIGIIFWGYIAIMWIVMKNYPANSFLPALLGLIFISIPLLTSIEAKKKFKKNPNANKKLKFMIDNEAIEIKTDGLEEKYTWENIYKVKKIKKGYLIFIQPRSAHWIPVSSMKKEDILIIEEIIRNNCIKTN